MTIPHDEPERLLLTIPEVASLLSMSPSTVRRLIESAELRSVKVRGTRRIPRVTVDAYVERLAEEGAA